jgi:hypothetical protein
MQELDLFKIFTSKLNELKLNYFVTGSVASIIYGEPRLTYDVDIVLEIKTTDTDAFRAAFPQEQFYLPPAEIIQNEMNRSERGHFNVIHHDSGFKADIYLAGKDDFQRWGLDNRKEVPYGNSVLYVAPPEYVIIKKLEFYNEGHSAKHLSDIESILRNSSEIIDRALIEDFASKFGLTDLWKRVSESIKN